MKKTVFFESPNLTYQQYIYEKGVMPHELDEWLYEEGIIDTSYIKLICEKLEKGI